MNDLVTRLRLWEGDGHPHGLLHRESRQTIEELCAVLATLRALDLAALALEPGVSCDADEHDAALEAAGALVAKYQPKGDEL